MRDDIFPLSVDAQGRGANGERLFHRPLGGSKPLKRRRATVTTPLSRDSIWGTESAAVRFGFRCHGLGKPVVK
jgi:hypothetical protein